MFLLRAPYPSMSTTILLPNPDFGDSRSLKATVTTMRTMDGTLFTYVKRKGGLKKFTWRFLVSRHKALELEIFLESYFSDKIQAVDHNSEKWVGYIINNPFELTGGSRAGGWPGEEDMNVEVQFEEAS